MMFCSHCGEKIDDGSKFCEACGASIEAAVTPPDADRQPNTVARVPTAPAPEPQRAVAASAPLPSSFGASGQPSGAPCRGRAKAGLVLVALLVLAAGVVWLIKGRQDRPQSNAQAVPTPTAQAPVNPIPVAKTPVDQIPIAQAPVDQPITAVPAPLRRTVFDNGNKYAVEQGSAHAPSFTIQQATQIRFVGSYHWMGGRGAPPGILSLRDRNGRVYGPWLAQDDAQLGAPANVYWVAFVNVTLPPGTYTVVDSDPPTWSYNSLTGGAGFARVGGIAPTVPPR